MVPRTVMDKNMPAGKSARRLPLEKIVGKALPMTLNGRIFIARHGETVFNFAKRMQGDKRDTPLTRTLNRLVSRSIIGPISSMISA